MPSMNDERYLAAAVTDADDNMWVIGGTSNSEAAPSTEVTQTGRKVA